MLALTCEDVLCVCSGQWGVVGVLGSPGDRCLSFKNASLSVCWPVLSTVTSTPQQTEEQGARAGTLLHILFRFLNITVLHILVDAEQEQGRHPSLSVRCCMGWQSK
jgi:hypothetical protein